MDADCLDLVLITTIICLSNPLILPLILSHLLSHVPDMFYDEARVLWEREYERGSGYTGSCACASFTLNRVKISGIV